MSIIKKMYINCLKIMINKVEHIAFISANSLSLIGMYEPDCPKELLKNQTE